ncbi:major capsid protein [Streptomyces sp. NPDC057540]|uniref:major capsid protein n=1 Tax=Streptomyces sp. NPDC057540 TaxID=3346160 RepID=UPI0036AFBF5A
MRPGGAPQGHHRTQRRGAEQAPDGLGRRVRRPIDGRRRHPKGPGEAPDPRRRHRDHPHRAGCPRRGRDPGCRQDRRSGRPGPQRHPGRRTHRRDRARRGARRRPDAGGPGRAGARHRLRDRRDRPALDLSGVRRRQPRVLPLPPAPGTHVTAAVDVPGYTPGSDLNFDHVVRGINSRATAPKTAGGGVGQVISYQHPDPQETIVTDSSSAPEGTTSAMTASVQSRLPKGDLVASGGWCAPSETLYELTDTACRDMLWDAPEIQLSRGGLRYYKPLSPDASSMTFVHTEADDIAGNEGLARDVTARRSDERMKETAALPAVMPEGHGMWRLVVALEAPVEAGR